MATEAKDTMTILKILLPFGLVLFSLSIFVDAKYESKKYPTFSVGDILTFSEIEQKEGEQTETTISRKLVRKGVVSNKIFEIWEVTETETYPSITKKTSHEWVDENGNTFLDKDEDGDAVYNTIIGIGEKELSVGDQVVDNMVISTAAIFNNGTLLYDFYGEDNVTESLNKIISLSTDIGSVECFEFSYNRQIFVELTSNQEKIPTHATETGTIWYSNKYGLVKSEVTANYNHIIQGESSSSSDITTKTLISANISNSTANSISYNSNSSQTNFDGWSWHKWPWVYSDTLKNWLFYPTNAVWSNMHNKWFIWNSTTEDWVQSE